MKKRLLILLSGVMLIGISNLVIAEWYNVNGTITSYNENLTSGLLMGYKLDLGTGANETDVLGVYNINETNSPLNVSGKINGGKLFNGTNQYYVSPNGVNEGLAQAFSVCAWINLTDTDYSNIFGRAVMSGNEGFIFLTETGTKKLFVQLQQSGGGTTNLMSNTGVTNNVWTHVCTVCNATAGSCTFYQNGVADGSPSGVARTINSGGLKRTFIGVQNDIPPGSNKFTGMIDEVYLWNRNLSSVEVSLHYNITRDSLVTGQYPFTVTNPNSYADISYYNFSVRNTLTNASLSNFSLNISGQNYTNTFIQNGSQLFQERGNVLVSPNTTIWTHLEALDNGIYNDVAFDNFFSNNPQTEANLTFYLPKNQTGGNITNNTKIILWADYCFDAVICTDQRTYYTNPNNMRILDLPQSCYIYALETNALRLSIASTRANVDYSVQCYNTSDNVIEIADSNSGSYDLTEEIGEIDVLWDFGNPQTNMSLPLNTSLLYNLTYSKNGYVTNRYNNTNISLNHIGYLYLANSFLVYIYNEPTQNQTINQNLSLIAFSDTGIYTNYTVLNGSVFVSGLTPDRFTLIYGSITNQTYLERSYYLNLVEGNFYPLDLYLINNSISDIILVNTKSNFGEILSGTVVQLLRFFPLYNSYKVVDMCKTNSDGRCTLQAQLQTASQDGAFYKFRFVINDINYLETVPTKLYDTTYYFTISTSESILRAYNDNLDFFYDLSFTNGTNNFNFQFSNPDGTFTIGCLYVYRTIDNVQTLYNSSCVNSASASILLNVDNSTSSDYLAKAYAYYDNEPVYLDSLYQSFRVSEDANNLGKNGLFLAFIVILVFSLIAIYSAIISIILSGIALILLTWMGLISIGWSVIIGLCAVSIIIIMVNKRG